jgi:hypothetical protein
MGVYLEALDVWQARVVRPHVLLLYCFNRRFLTMLTIIPADDSVEF